MHPFEYFSSSKNIFHCDCDFLDRTVSNYATRYTISLHRSVNPLWLHSFVLQSRGCRVNYCETVPALAILLDSWDCTPQIICVENHPLILSPPTELPTASFVFHLVLPRPHFCSWRHLLLSIQREMIPLPLLSPENRPHFLSNKIFYLVHRFKYNVTRRIFE